jgi:hypothetical protein
MNEISSESRKDSEIVRFHNRGNTFLYILTTNNVKVS